VTKSDPHRRAKPDAPRRDWRHVHHSPWFWVGVAMFLTAILTYAFSEDLSLRPRLHRSGQGVEGKSVLGLSSPSRGPSVILGAIAPDRPDVCE
jgi:hypothetical protein